MPNTASIDNFRVRALELASQAETKTRQVRKTRWTAVEIDPAEEYAPLKNATGEASPESVRQAISARAARWLKRAGVAVPREVRDQFRVGKNVDRDQLAPGDLVFFSTVAPGASHVGIVIGGDQFVHAPSERGVVRVESLNSQYWSSRYVGAKRIS